MSIAVFGGNGFLGRKICEYAVKNGFEVTSFTKSGRPPVLNEYLEQVNWESADLFDESSYKSKLSEYQTVFHSVGKIFDDVSYKSAIGSRGANFKFLKNLIMGSNPMNKTVFNSFDGINKDSALRLASNYSKVNKNGKFVYISADRGLPIAPTDYIRTKREAEHELLTSKLNTLIIRPGIMYDENERNNRYHFVQGLKSIYEIKNATIKGNRCIDENIRPILSTDEVCSGIFKNLEKDNSIITLNDLISANKKTL